MGYGQAQMAELAETIKKVPCDVVLVGTPIDLGSLIDIPQPSTRVFYNLDEEDKSVLPAAIERVI